MLNFKKVFSLIICSTLAVSILLINPIDSKALSGNEPTYTYWIKDSSTLQKTTNKLTMIEWISIDGRKSKIGTVKYVTLTKNKRYQFGHLLPVPQQEIENVFKRQQLLAKQDVANSQQKIVKEDE